MGKKATYFLHFLQIFCIFWINVSKFRDTLYINLINGAFCGNFNLRVIFETLKHTQVTRLHITLMPLDARAVEK